MPDAGDTILRFGKYKGAKIRDVPVEYLDYLLGWDELYPSIRADIEAYLKTQADYDAMDGPKDWREGREDYTGED
jgi:hypothetical protein